MICWKILLISVISSVLSAPVDKDSLLSIIAGDRRTEKLRKHKFVAECKADSDFSKSLCFAMYDVGLSYNISNLEFYRDENIKLDGQEFCKTLTEIIPDTPANNDSAVAFKDKAQWFKDILKKDDGNKLCVEKCSVTDFSSYDTILRPSCQFLFNQFNFLRNQSIARNTDDSKKSDEGKRES